MEETKRRGNMLALITAVSPAQKRLTPFASTRTRTGVNHARAGDTSFPAVTAMQKASVGMTLSDHVLGFQPETPAGALSWASSLRGPATIDRNRLASHIARHGAH